MRIITTDPETCAALEEAYRDRKPVEFMGKKYIGTSGEFNPGFGALGPKCSMSMHIISEPAWVGIGPPPVGLRCETELYKGGGWIAGHVAYYGKAHFVFESDQLEVGVEIAGKIGTSFFRPLRTPEQIAAEEREHAAAEMSQATQGAKNWADAFRMLHDAGYHK